MSGRIPIEKVEKNEIKMMIYENFLKILVL